MRIEPGQRLLHYRLIEKIGEGGMGVVWKAIDTTLDREVAIKILPEVFAVDAERLARFQREAKLLASLNHPNIAAVYGLHETGGRRFLAMELVPGEDLGQRLQRGPVRADDAIEVATQIATALEAAHGQGVIHRDLKPANVVLAPDGGVKVLDFGLAKTTEEGSASSDPSASPTVTSAGTMAGVILGTAAYMSPEQAKGRPLDRRSDIWSFGVTLLEMLTGHCPFRKDTVSETLAEVLKSEPDLGVLPPGTPSSVRRVLKRCLVKDPNWRLCDMGDARIELRAAAEEEPDVGEPAAPAKRSSPAVTWALGAVALLAIAVATWFALRPETAPEPISMEITLPPGVTVDMRPAISPDGRTVAYRAGGLLYLRDLSSFEPRRVGEATGLGGPFFSPDGSEVAYFASGALRKVALAGGSPTHLVDTPGLFGGTWAADGSIVWAPTLNAGLHRLTAGSTEPERLTEPDFGTMGYAHIFPQALPDGRILYTQWGEREEHNFILDLKTRESTPVRGSRLTSQSVAFYAPGHLLVGDRETGLKIAPVDLDAATVTGPARSVASGVYWDEGVHLSLAAVSPTGNIVYVPGDPSRRRLVWVDQEGRATPAIETEQRYRFPEVSPDGRRAALSVGPDIVVLDLERGSQTRLTAFKGDQLGFKPLWMPDGKRVLYASNVSGRWDLYVRNADATGESEMLMDWEPTTFPDSISPDGVVLLTTPGADTTDDLWVMEPGEEPRPYVKTPFVDQAGRFSPDGGLVAYSSNESGRFEVYVQAYPEGGERYLVSTEGGEAPVWSRDGSRLYYGSGRKIWGVQVTRSPALRFGNPVRLFEGDFEIHNWSRFSVDAEGRFLMVLPLPESIPDRLRVVVGWGSRLG